VRIPFAEILQPSPVFHKVGSCAAVTTRSHRLLALPPTAARWSKVATTRLCRSVFGGVPRRTYSGHGATLAAYAGGAIPQLSRPVEAIVISNRVLRIKEP